MRATFLALLLFVSAANAKDTIPTTTETASAAYTWLDIALEATAREVDRMGARPTVTSRTLAVALTAMYDAWAAYDAKAVGSRFGGQLRRPVAERTLKNREVAIAYAAYRALHDIYPEDRAWLEQQMRRLGHDPKNMTTDLATPQGVGNVAAAAVIEFRHRDGANQLGDEAGSNGVAYSDYTFYQPVNSPTQVLDPDRWQSVPWVKKDVKEFHPPFLTPHWYRVKPFALKRADQFRPGPPPKVGSRQLLKEVEENLRMNAALTAEQKAIVEFMRDGPRSTGQSGHWLRFAQDVSRRDRHDLDQDVKLFFAVANVAFDAFIACWDSKRVYDSSRPWTLVRHYFKGKTVNGWLGPGKGTGPIPAESWLPYSPLEFLTPPFPGYVSGHSTVSAAAAKTLELFTGSDRFGQIERRRAGQLTEDGLPCATIMAREGRPDPKAVCDVELKLPTFTATAEMAGISRVLGGYHIQADNLEGLKLGRKVAEYSWPLYKQYFEGRAKIEGEMDPVRIASAFPAIIARH